MHAVPHPPVEYSSSVSTGPGVGEWLVTSVVTTVPLSIAQSRAVVKTATVGHNAAWPTVIGSCYILRSTDWFWGWFVVVFFQLLLKSVEDCLWKMRPNVVACKHYLEPRA
ncbi:hypothetical protein BaRGS_00000577 [Batillaria attramentaria]|uniref:Uncharacterized protein n=1 Tax=Batillaria attramentaria TaxID=370345 RepID=A0ABD0MB49_9CAEN